MRQHRFADVVGQGRGLGEVDPDRACFTQDHGRERDPSVMGDGPRDPIGPHWRAVGTDWNLRLRYAESDQRRPRRTSPSGEFRDPVRYRLRDGRPLSGKQALRAADLGPADAHTVAQHRLEPGPERLGPHPVRWRFALSALRFDITALSSAAGAAAGAVAPDTGAPLAALSATSACSPASVGARKTSAIERLVTPKVAFI